MGQNLAELRRYEDEDEVIFGPPHPDQDRWDWLQRRPCHYIPIDVTNATIVLITGPCLYKGGSVRDPAATASAITLRDSLDTSGPRIVAQQLLASGTVFFPTPYWGVFCRAGIALSVATGRAIGGFWVVW